jgi:hypothetical protein
MSRSLDPLLALVLFSTKPYLRKENAVQKLAGDFFIRVNLV